MDIVKHDGASALDDLTMIATQMYDRWDADMKAGKLLIALMGNLPKYDQRVTRIREILGSYASLTAERDALRGALVDVMNWINAWHPPFVEDDEWPATASRIKDALASEPRP